MSRRELNPDLRGWEASTQKTSHSNSLFEQAVRIRNIYMYIWARDQYVHY